MRDAEQRQEARLDLLGGGRWVRSQGYYIEAGMIRLAPDAELEVYDPWEEWRTAVDEERPYKRLLRLSQQLHPPRMYGPLPRREQQQLEKWVQENGLLGILPHETLEATMAPRWVDEQEFAGADESSTGGARSFIAVQRQQLCKAQHWPVYLRRIGEARTSDPALEGELVPADQLGGAGLPVDVLRRRVQDASIERRSLEKHYHEFFPEVPREEAWTYDYPGVDSDRFWRSYSESARLLVGTARYLAAPLAGLARMRGEELSDDDSTLIWQALQRINAMASVVDLAGALSETDEFFVGWASPSLLGMYALMLLNDLSAGHQVKRCPNCEIFFLAKNPRARYCSSTCRHAQQKRVWRKAKATKRGLGDASDGD